MLYIAYCKDREGAVETRLANRAAHLEWVGSRRDMILGGGPFLSPDGQTMIGSLFFIKAEDRAAVDALLAEDPYRKAGLFGSSEIHPWKWVVGAPDGIN